MGWFLIRKRDTATGIQFAACLPFHQHRQTPCGERQFRFLSRDDIGQLLDRAGEVSDLFFEMCGVSHEADVCVARSKGKSLYCI